MARDVSSISNELKAMKEYLAMRKRKEDLGKGGGRANALYSKEEGEAVD
jgi:hypothetical protein